MKKILVIIILLVLAGCTEIPLTDQEKKAKELQRIQGTEVVIVTNKITEETFTIENVATVLLIHRSTFNNKPGIIKIIMSGTGTGSYEFSEEIYAYMSMPYRVYQELENE